MSIAMHRVPIKLDQLIIFVYKLFRIFFYCIYMCF